jgi:hypothetical protein
VHWERKRGEQDKQGSGGAGGSWHQSPLRWFNGCKHIVAVQERFFPEKLQGGRNFVP